MTDTWLIVVYSAFHGPPHVFPLDFHKHMVRWRAFLFPRLIKTSLMVSARIMVFFLCNFYLLGKIHRKIECNLYKLNTLQMEINCV